MIYRGEATVLTDFFSLVNEEKNSVNYQWFRNQTNCKTGLEIWFKAVRQHHKKCSFFHWKGSNKWSPKKAFHQCWLIIGRKPLLRSGQVVKKDLCGKKNFIKPVSRVLKTWWSASPWPWQLQLNWHLSSISQSCFLVIAQHCLCFLSYHHHPWLLLEGAVAYKHHCSPVTSTMWHNRG